MQLLNLVVVSHRRLISWQRPYCVDLGESTFGVLKTFLESNMLGILQEELTAPFDNTRYKDRISFVDFVL